jgi:RNA polymerase sigma factor (sigma-70 family)
LTAGGPNAMTSLTSAVAGRDLATLFEVGAVGLLSDADLLTRFHMARGDAASEAAFEAIVARHGPMVLGVCRRVLGDVHDAADAFQATFLILARKAPTVRVEGSLGRWLHGVSVRVARRSRATAQAERARVHRLVRHAPPNESTPPDALSRVEVRAAIDEEIARLPDRYQSAVVLCHLEGLSQEQAAQRLGCPVGTIESRLHRARGRLRTALNRRGLAPIASGAALLTASTSRAEVPSALAASTIAAVTDGPHGSAVTATVAALVSQTLRGMHMIKARWIGLFLTTIGLTAAGAAVVAGGDDKKPAQAARAADAPRAEPKAAEQPIADRLAQILAEYQAKQDALRQALEKVENQREINQIYGKMSPDEVAFCRRMIDLATSAPKDPSARKALVWVVDKPGMSDEGTYGDEFARAAALLVRHHGDDPEAIRVGLTMDNLASPHRDALLTGFYASANGREAKGLARLALAQYLEQKAKYANGTKTFQARHKIKYIGVIGDDGKPFDKEVEQSTEDYTYILQLRLCDPNAIRAEAERLYGEVIAVYGDIPHRTVRGRALEALLKEPTPKWNGKPLTPDELRKLSDIVKGKRTLADEANGRLDETHNLVDGKPAPEIDGVDSEGKPLKLSDHRGKVVVLVFWGSWCGPCMRQVPHERELVERLKGKPFALLGVNCREDKSSAIKTMKAERMTWPNWIEGDGDGPIVSRYHVRGFPTVFVIDKSGIIRGKGLHGEYLDKLVDDLLKETPSNDARKAAGSF